MYLCVVVCVKRINVYVFERERSGATMVGRCVYYCVLVQREDRQKKNETMNCVFLRVGGEGERL